MALSAAEEARVRALLAQDSAILSLAVEEPAIISNLGATNVSLSDLAAATSLIGTDLLLVRQGTTDKSATASLVAGLATAPDASTTVKGIVELATNAETIAGTDTVRAVHPAGLAAALAATPQSAAIASYSNLKASATGTGNNITVTADEIVLADASNVYKTVRAVSLTVSPASSGANGLDTGTSAASTWYSLWVINNGTTTAGLLSLSATAPTMPSGYTFKARIGWIRTDASGNKYPLSFIQFGKFVGYKVASGSNVADPFTIASGVASWPTAVSVSNHAPPTASRVKLITNVTGTDSWTRISPSNVSQLNAVGIAGYSSATGASSFEANIILESTNIYWEAAGVSSMYFVGWEDNL